MQRRAWFRFGLAALVAVGGGAAALVGCSDDTTSSNPTDDGGTGDDGSTPPVDSGPGDGGGGGDGGDASTPPHAKAIIVHGSADTNVGAVRVCFGLKKTGTANFVVPPLLALPDTALPGQPYAGLFPGTGGPLPDLLDLVDYEIKPYIIPAALIAADAKGVDGGTPRTCQDLVGGGDGGLPANEFVPLPVIPAGTFAHASTLVLAVTGCAANAKVGDQPFCGTDYNDTNGNLAAHIYSVDRKVGAALGAQFAHLSSGAQAFGPLYPVISNALPDGGSDDQVVTPGPVPFAGFGPDAGATQITGVDPATSSFSLHLPLVDGGVGPSAGSAPLLLVQQATIGTTTPADYFKNGQNYTFVVVGNPGVSVDGGGGSFNGYGIHFLGFNNDPVLPSP